MDTEKQGKDGQGLGAGEQPTQALPLDGTQALDPFATASLERERMLQAMEAARQQNAAGEATLILKPPAFDPEAASRTQGFPLAEIEDMPTDPGLAPPSSPTGPIPVAAETTPRPGDDPTTQLPPLAPLPETRLSETPAEETPAIPTFPEAAPEATQIITRPDLTLPPPAQEPTLVMRGAEPAQAPEPVPEPAPEPAPAQPPAEDLRTRAMPIQAAEVVQEAPTPNPVSDESPVCAPPAYASGLEPVHRGPARLWIAGGILVAGLAIGALLVFRPVRSSQPSAPSAQTAQAVPPAPVPPALQPYLDRALAGDPAAMHMLGVRYYNGLDVPQNRAEGLRWYRKAAAAGNRAAQEELRQLQ